MREYQQYIGGEWVSSDSLFDDLDPYRGTVMARVPAGTRADAARAVAAAAAAFPAWAAMAPGTSGLFLNAADLVEQRLTEIVRVPGHRDRASQLRAFPILSAALLRQAAGWGYLPLAR